MYHWTLVQHSGYVTGQKAEFEHAVETAVVSSKSLSQRIMRAGGVVIEDYNEASDTELEVNYPTDNLGLVPQAFGTFTRIEGLYLPLYQPTRNCPAWLLTREGQKAMAKVEVDEP